MWQLCVLGQSAEDPEALVAAFNSLAVEREPTFIGETLDLSNKEMSEHYIPMIFTLLRNGIRYRIYT